MVAEKRFPRDNEAQKARVFRYRLTDKPTVERFMIAVDCDLEEARTELERRFAGRVLEVREHAAD